MVYLLAGAVVLAAVVLHAPWSGYTTQTVPEKVDTLTVLRECPRISQTSTPQTTGAEVLSRFTDNLACASRLQPVPVPIKITRWRSKEPLVHAFGRLRNIVAGALLAMIAAVVLSKALDWALAVDDKPRIKAARR